MRSETLAGASASLAKARHTGHRLDRLPADCRPADVVEACAIQDPMIQALGPIRGWKVDRSGKYEGGMLSAASRAEIGYLLERLARHDPRARLS